MNNSKINNRGNRLRKEIANEKKALGQRAKNAAALAYRPKPSKKKEKKSGWKGKLADLIGSGITAGGSLIGQPLAGAALGAGVSAGLRAIWGSGTYHVGSNSILEGGANLTFNRTAHGLRVTNREYVTGIRSGVTLVAGATEFQNTSYPINPGNSALFPWLAGLVTNKFVKYKFHGLVFEYVPTSGASVASSNTALGTIAGAVNPDPNDSPWTSMTELLHAENAISSVPANSVVWPVECATADQVTSIRFVSNFAPDGEIDPRLVSPGTFQLATMGQQAVETELGQLWATYDIELFDPILEGGTLGCEGIYNSAGIPTRILENSSVPVVLTVSSVYMPEANHLTFNAPFEGMMMFQFTSCATQIQFSISSSRPTTFELALVGDTWDVGNAAQVVAYMIKAESGTVMNLGGVAAPSTFETRVYFMPFPFGAQYWPLVFGPRAPHRALRAMTRREFLADSDDDVPLEGELVPTMYPISRPNSPALSVASSKKSTKSYVRV